MNACYQSVFADFYCALNSEDLSNYPLTNPLFIAVDALSFQLIQRLQGFSLLYDGLHPPHDWRFCFQREVWVLYAKANHFQAAMFLAQTIQQSGAAKISTLLIAPALFSLSDHAHD